MRVLLGHNFYSSSKPSGENQVFELERALLESKGHEVSLFTRNSDEIIHEGVGGNVRGALATPWNPWMKKKVQRTINDFSPHVMHVHNTFPLLSPSIFYGAKGRTARVLTLHNYRLFCPAAIPMREGKVCTECLDTHSSWPSIKHGCYRKSRIATIPLASSVSLHRFLKTWDKHVDGFIALTDFQRDLMVDAGLPQDKVHIKPNFYSGSPNVVSWNERKPYVVFAGRLSEEKGVISLLKAWAAWGPGAPELRLVGDGELRSKLEAMASNLPIKFLGQMTSEEAEAQVANASLQILPSEWFEGFPMVVREAFAFGTPSAVSDIGPLPSIVTHGKNGVVFQPSDHFSLLKEVKKIWDEPGKLESLGRGARYEFEDKYTEESNYSMLLEIYEKAIWVSRNE